MILLSITLLATVASQDTAARPDTTRPRQLPAVEVIGTPDRLRRIPGSGTVLGSRAIGGAYSRNVNETLRRVPGIHVRDEDGIGLRPNIGIRGLNPTRSTTVLLLEDGVPFSLAPYGDNGSYYVPPIDRFAGVEVLKGHGQIAYGPRTIGGVVNLLSPAVPLGGSQGRVALGGGSKGYRLAHGRFGVGGSGSGLLLDLLHKQAGSGRGNIGTTINDATLKTELGLPGGQTMALKANYYRERSQVTYSGLREDEYAADPFANPFVNDSMFMDRLALSAGHRTALGGTAALKTLFYATFLSRDWWRQSSNSAERPNDASDPACAGLANLTTGCGNQGRLRDYRVLGLEPRLLVDLSGLMRGAELEAGVRLHLERQERRQENGAEPNSRVAGPSANPNAGIVEDNVRDNAAVSAFLQPRFTAGRWTITPGLRAEHVWYERTNRLSPGSGAGLIGRTELTQLIPGLGVSWNPSPATTLFAGVHRGFAPPRTEDILTNAGGQVELDAELSWNTEVGARLTPGTGIRLEATLFQLDFSNQIVPASVAGGAGATLTSAGRTLHRGVEVGGRIGSEAFAAGLHRVWVEAAWTWLPVARYDGDRYAWIGTGGGDVPGKVYLAQNAGGTRTEVQVTGNRLPYAPEHLLTAAAGFEHAAGPELRLEAVYQGSQFADPVNTSVTVPDGQQGPIAGALVWNASAALPVRVIRGTVSLAAKNLFDRRYLVDRSRGLMPGAPRLVQVGIATDF